MENATQSIDSIDVWDVNDYVWKEHANMSIARHGHSTGSIGQLFPLKETTYLEELLSPQS